MTTYEKLFSMFGLNVAQVLLTHDDLQHHERHLNARNTLVTLLDRGVVPVINENDAVSFTELQFGDNDQLSALVACLLPDRKSTRLNSSHSQISYAVFCLKKKKKIITQTVKIYKNKDKICKINKSIRMVSKMNKLSTYM